MPLAQDIDSTYTPININVESPPDDNSFIPVQGSPSPAYLSPFPTSDDEYPLSSGSSTWSQWSSDSDNGHVGDSLSPDDFARESASPRLFQEHNTSLCDYEFLDQGQESACAEGGNTFSRYRDSAESPLWSPGSDNFGNSFPDDTSNAGDAEPGSLSSPGWPPYTNNNDPPQLDLNPLALGSPTCSDGFLSPTYGMKTRPRSHSEGTVAPQDIFRASYPGGASRNYAQPTGVNHYPRPGLTNGSTTDSSNIPVFQNAVPPSFHAQPPYSTMRSSSSSLHNALSEHNYPNKNDTLQRRKSDCGPRGRPSLHHIVGNDNSFPSLSNPHMQPPPLPDQSSLSTQSVGLPTIQPLSVDTSSMSQQLLGHDLHEPQPSRGRSFSHTRSRERPSTSRGRPMARPSTSTPATRRHSPYPQRPPKEIDRGSMSPTTQSMGETSFQMASPFIHETVHDLPTSQVIGQNQWAGRPSGSHQRHQSDFIHFSPEPTNMAEGMSHLSRSNSAPSSRRYNDKRSSEVGQGEQRASMQTSEFHHDIEDVKPNLGMREDHVMQQDRVLSLAIPTSDSTKFCPHRLTVTSNATRVASEKRRRNTPKFTCQVPGCGTVFTAKHNYDRHMNAHNGVKPYPCACGQAFTNQSDRKRHQGKSKNPACNPDPIPC